MGTSLLIVLVGTAAMVAVGTIVAVIMTWEK
jgi:hypothetical protein